MNMRKAPELKVWNALNSSMVFFFMSLGTMRARSSCQISNAMKMIRMSTKPTRVPTTSAEFHGLATPPHCKARMRQTKDAIKMNVPGRSICSTFSRSDAASTFAAFGVWKKKKMIAAEAPPMGRLI
jgi:hypothetical protein